MEFILTILTPFWSVWTLLMLIFCHGWALAVITVVLITLIFSLRYRYNKVNPQRNNLVQLEVINAEVLKVLPVDTGNGWFLKGMSQGIRVFSRFSPLLSNQHHSHMIAATSLLDASPKRALLNALSAIGVPAWFGPVQGAVRTVVKPSLPINKLPSSGDSDTIGFEIVNELSPMKKLLIKFCETLCLVLGNFSFLKGLIPDTSKISSEKVKRMWRPEGKAYHLLASPVRPSCIPYEWSFFLFSVVPNHKDITMVTMIALPTAQDPHLLKDFLAFQICALREYTLTKEIKAVVPSPTTSKRSPLPTTNHKLQQPPDSISCKSTDSASATTENAVVQSKPLEVAGISETDPDYHYVEMGRKCASDLLEAANATEQDGWSVVSNNKGVFIMKKLPSKGSPPINCVKGTMRINAPPDFILRVLMDPTHAIELDDMMKEMREIKIITPYLALLHLLYKAVWPTSPRDFAVMNVVGRTDPHTRVHAACSIVDPRIPEIKGYVRGAVLAGGYVVKDVPGSADSAEVTYITQVDLKGSVPSFVVNKIVESQPQCVNQLNNIIVKEYAQLCSNPEKLREFEDKYPINSIHESEKKSNPVPVSLEEDTITGPVNKPNELSVSQVSTLSTSDTCYSESEATFTAAGIYSGNDTSEVGVVSDPSNGDATVTLSTSPDKKETSMDDIFGERNVPGIPMSAVLDRLPRYEGNSNCDEQEQGSLTDSLLEYPRNEGAVDFRTLGNQIAARMLEEMFNISGLDVMNPRTYKDQQGGWKLQGFEKDVAILKKKVPDSPFHSFIGRGLINLPPQEVFNCVRNPNQRFTYDSMLKELHIVKQVEEGIYILHLHHEATQCFLKQSRDFCLLVCERSEPNKKLIVGSSVEVPECPPHHSITRGKVLTSGWVIEPYRRENKLCTQVTYTVQVDMGGVPAAIVNFVSRRQPLAVAYIRDFLESTSLSCKERSLEGGSSPKLPRDDEDNISLNPVWFKI